MNQTVNTTKRRVPWLWLLVSLGVIAIDQLTKWLCVAYLKPVGRVTLIPNFLKLTYVENRGAAFGSEGLGSFPVAKDVQRKSLHVLHHPLGRQNGRKRFALQAVVLFRIRIAIRGEQKRQRAEHDRAKHQTYQYDYAFFGNTDNPLSGNCQKICDANLLAVKFACGE